MIDLVKKGIEEKIDGYMKEELKGRLIENLIQKQVIEGKKYGMKIED